MLETAARLGPYESLGIVGARRTMCARPLEAAHHHQSASGRAGGMR
jgi:hypothetical protein